MHWAELSLRVPPIWKILTALSIALIYYSEDFFNPQKWLWYWKESRLLDSFKENHLFGYNPCAIISSMRSRTKMLEHGSKTAEVEVSWHWRCSVSSGTGYCLGRSLDRIVETLPPNTDMPYKVQCPRCMGSSSLIPLRIKTWMSNPVGGVWQLGILDIRQPRGFS